MGRQIAATWQTEQSTNDLSDDHAAAAPKHKKVPGDAGYIPIFLTDAEREELRAMAEASRAPALPRRRYTEAETEAYDRSRLNPRGRRAPRSAAAAEAPARDAGELILLPASDIPIRAVDWLWQDRLPLGELALLAGREGVGKSTFDSWLTAWVSTGKLPGAFVGKPRNVLVVATEDDWSTTLVPRLMAAGADLERVYRVAVRPAAQKHASGQLQLPEQLGVFEGALKAVQPGLVVLSPLMSRLSGKLDSHKDQEVRQALEPLVYLAQQYQTSLLGLIHLNKSAGSDPLRAVMGSTAFVGVARAVLFVQRDSEDPDLRVLGQPKNNLGLTDYELGLKTFRIESADVGQDAKRRLVTATRLAWEDDRKGSIEQMLEEATHSLEQRTAVEAAADWLKEYLTAAGGMAAYQEVLKDGKAQGHSLNPLKRALRKLGGYSSRTASMPATSEWRLDSAIPMPVFKSRKQP